MNSTRIVVTVLALLSLGLVLAAGFAGAEKLTLVLALASGCGWALSSNSDSVAGTLASVAALFLAVAFAWVEAGLLVAAAMIGIVVLTGSAIGISQA